MLKQICNIIKSSVVFIKENKKWYIIPFFIVLIFLILLIIFFSGNSVMPIIYAVF